MIRPTTVIVLLSLMTSAVALTGCDAGHETSNNGSRDNAADRQSDLQSEPSAIEMTPEEMEELEMLMAKIIRNEPNRIDKMITRLQDRLDLDAEMLDVESEIERYRTRHSREGVAETSPRPSPEQMPLAAPTQSESSDSIRPDGQTDPSCSELNEEDCAEDDFADDGDPDGELQVPQIFWDVPDLVGGMAPRFGRQPIQITRIITSNGKEHTP